MRMHRAIAVWGDIVGDKLAPFCWAETARQGVLFVRTSSNVWANELGFYKQDLLKKLADRLGAGVITDIYIRAGGRKKDPAQPVHRGVRRPTEAELMELGANDHTEGAARILNRARSMLAWKREHGWKPCVHCRSLVPPHEFRFDNLCPLCARR